MTTPSSNLYILEDVPFSNDYKNLLTFSNSNSQFNYFSGLAKFSNINDFTYIRKNNVIRVEFSAETLYNCNYLIYRNTAYGNKWFYAFITNISYVADSTSYIEFEEDLWQTWQFNFEFKKCFVEREHVTDDSIGANTVPEGLELGDYIETACDPLPISNINVYTPSVYVAATDVPWDRENTVGDENYLKITGAGISVIEPGVRNGEVNGLTYFNCGLNIDVNIEARLNTLFDVFNKSNVTIEAIRNVFLSTDIVDNNTPYASSYEWGFLPNTYKGYTPVNNKLYTYPYCGLQVYSPVGGFTLKYELINNKTQLYYGASSGLSCKIKVYVRDYATETSGGDITPDFGNSITYSPYPQGSWGYDSYANWVNLHGLSTVLGIASIPLNVAGNFSGGVNPLGLAGSAYSAVNSVAKITETLKMPDGIKGSASNPDSWYSFNMHRIRQRRIQIKPEYAKIIDDYFTKYGYKVNRYKVPNINTRQGFNYVKTIDAIVTGDCPVEALQVIKNSMDTGVTFWHTTNIGG